MKLNRLHISMLLVIVVLAVYWPVRGYDFVNVNDFEYVTRNAHVINGLSWANVTWAFKSQVAGNWHPLTLLSHMLDCQWYGVNAGAHHFTSVLLHMANTVLLFWVLLRITGKKEEPNSNLWPCALVAALFALHPLRVESVVWISERKDVLCAFFFLLTIGAYVRYVEKSKVGWYTLSLLFFAFGLMSKPMLVTLPCVLLLLDYWPLGRTGMVKLLLEKIPFFLLTVVLSVVTFLVQKSVGAVGALEKLPVTARLANAMVSYARYLSKTVWSDSLSALYPIPDGWAAWQVGGAVILFVGLSLLAIWSVRRRKYLFVGWFWFAGMLVPVIGLIQVGQQAMADRYTYLPSIGLFMAVVWGLDEFFSFWGKRFLLVILGVILTVGCIATTAVQVRYWRDTQTLIQRTVDVTGKNPRANALLGTTLANLGKPEEAVVYLERAVQDKPDFAEAHGDLAMVLAKLGKIDEAKKSYETALRLKSSLPLAHYGLANILSREGQLDEAISHYDEAVRLKTNFAEAHASLAALYYKQGKNEAAALGYTTALKYKPSLSTAHMGLATLLNEQGKPDLAFDHYVQVLRANPNIADAHYQLSVILNVRHDSAGAIEHLERVVKLSPDMIPALNSLAWSRAADHDPKLRNGTEALGLARRAAKLTREENPAILDTLAVAFAETGRFEEAAQVAETAIQEARAGEQKDLAGEIESHLKLFLAKKPYHE